MKRITKKQRGKIYLLAAKKEDIAKSEGIGYMRNKVGYSFFSESPMYKWFPELELVTGIVAYEDLPIQQQLRVTTLLFCHQMCK